MAQYILKKSPALCGEAFVQRSKNAVLPMMACCLMTQEPIELCNVPQRKRLRLRVRLELPADADRHLERHARRAAEIAREPPADNADGIVVKRQRRRGAARPARRSVGGVGKCCVSYS